MENRYQTSLTDLMKAREEAKRESLRENGQIIKREMLKLVELIDAGEWEAFTVRRGAIATSGPVDTCVDAIRSELRRRDNLMHYAKMQLGGYEL